MEGPADEPVATQQETKPKRKLSEAQLAQLAKAREKANAVRKRNAEQRQSQKQKEQQLRDLKRHAHEQEIETELTKYRKPAQQSVVELESESSEEEPSSSSSEEEPPPRKPRKVKRQVKRSKRKPVKQRRHTQVSESDTDTSDEEYIPDKPAMRRQQQQNDMYDRQIQRAFASLFPN